jgi:hypothetical protein
VEDFLAEKVKDYEAKLPDGGHSAKDPFEEKNPSSQESTPNL